MWTFLAMLVSILIFVGVFVRRLFFTVKGYDDKPSEVLKSDEDDDLYLDDEEKIRLKKGQRQQVNELFASGEKLVNAGNIEEAIKVFVKILSIDPKHEASKEKLAVLYLQKEMYSSAAILFEALAKANDNPVHYSHWGVALYQQGDYEKAKGAYIQALKLDSSRAQRYISLSQIYRAMGQFYNAMIALNKGVEVQQENGGDIIDFWLLIADLQQEMNMIEASRATLEGILIIDSENEDAKRMLKELKDK